MMKVFPSIIYTRYLSLSIYFGRYLSLSISFGRYLSPSILWRRAGCFVECWSGWDLHGYYQYYFWIRRVEWACQDNWNLQRTRSHSWEIRWRRADHLNYYCELSWVSWIHKWFDCTSPPLLLESLLLSPEASCYHLQDSWISTGEYYSRSEVSDFIWWISAIHSRSSSDLSGSFPGPITDS